VLTDRNDLDGQLFGTFSRCKDVLHQPPVQAYNGRSICDTGLPQLPVVFCSLTKGYEVERKERLKTPVATRDRDRKGPARNDYGPYQKVQHSTLIEVK
jgi:hypothetical protein